MICEVYHYDRSKDRSVLAGTLTLNGEEITIEASKGCENTMESVKELSAMSDGGRIQLNDDPKLWFSLLPHTVRGSFWYALIVEGERVVDTPTELLGRGLVVFKDGKEIGQIDGDYIETEDVGLDDLFYDLIDEGVPVTVRRGVIRYEQATPERLIGHLQKYGYEVRSGKGP
ncbi:MAG: hypothetical protein WA172_10450 [Terriglobales bacterium]